MRRRMNDQALRHPLSEAGDLVKLFYEKNALLVKLKLMGVFSGARTWRVESRRCGHRSGHVLAAGRAPRAAQSALESHADLPLNQSGKGKMRLQRGYATLRPLPNAGPQKHRLEEGGA